MDLGMAATKQSSSSSSKSVAPGSFSLKKTETWISYSSGSFFNLLKMDRRRRKISTAVLQGISKHGTLNSLMPIGN
ncbi:hypothetical protein OIU84_000513 [Salix udensis]|uniref:Uncharacterized protein n=1 Tax=Salix udensis TaxID=889485 RepID=A0AAD6L523_9ROSI|nr:hypothetical protein OIU84_000513 [Salix udensis]